MLLVPVRPRPTAAKTDGGPVSTSVWTPAILTLTLLFTMISLASAGISQFSIVAFMGGRGISFETANIALTAYLSMSAGGVLVGGYLADRTHRHDLVATINYGLNGVVLLCVAIIPMAPLLLIIVMGCAGFLSGSITGVARHDGAQGIATRRYRPRLRHCFDRALTSAASSGRCCIGWIMDHGMPLWVFYVTAVFMVGTSLATLFADYVRRSAQAAE